MLIVGRQSRAKAQSVLGDSYAAFEHGPDVQGDHLGLLLQIGNLGILKMNKTGSTLFWPAGDPEMPPFCDSRYSRPMLLELSPAGFHGMDRRFRVTRNPQHGWQPKYRTAIRERTNILPR